MKPTLCSVVYITIKKNMILPVNISIWLKKDIKSSIYIFINRSEKNINLVKIYNLLGIIQH